MIAGRNGEICVVKRQKSDIIRVERENVYMRDETKIDLYAADRNTAYKLIENAGSDGNAIEDTDLKENLLKIAHFRHAIYVADEKYPVQVFYGASDQ